MQVADRGLVALRRGSVQTAYRVDGRREKRQREMNREHPDFAFCLSAGTLRSESETERKPEVPACPGDEALFHCAKPSGVLRGPANSTASLNSQKHTGNFPKVTSKLLHSL